jgi:GNAT superfamily N-acetyltransferase
MPRQRPLEFHPLTPERWHDFEALFGKNGACGGCWCMLWRRKRADFDQRKGNGNKHAMRRLVTDGAVPGILAYADGEAIGWCALAPRADYPALARSRVLKPVDDQAVWSISCFFIRREHRRQGVSVRLLQAAVEHVRRCGGTILEGYPVEPRSEQAPGVFLWTGTLSAFKRAGFVEVGRGSPTRPIMRFTIASARRTARARKA